jgi:LPXTG-motif cell wall-anchored protein
VAFYTTTYGVFDGEGDGRTPRAVDGSTSATDGGVIINTPVDAVELPSTGGSGTHLIYILGSALTIFAVALLGIRRIRHGQ